MTINSSKRKNIKNLISQINKKFGDSTVNILSDVEESLRIRRLKSPSVEFNIMLGGGLPVGKTTEFYGENSSGKTSKAIEIIKYNQKINPDFITGWFETEDSMDTDTLAAHGLDMDRVVYWDQRHVAAEKGFDILRSFVESGEFDFIVVNSIAGLCPEKEVSDDMQNANIALTARLLSKLFRVVTAPAAKTGTTLLFINQLRQNVGQMFGNPNTTTGGKALGYYASVRVGMSRVKLEAADPITADEGVKIKCKTIKNRFIHSNPFRECTYFARYGEGIDTISEMPDILAREGIVSKSGSWFNYLDESGSTKVVDGMTCKFRSKAVFVSALRENNALKEELEKKIYQAIESRRTGIALSEDEIEEIKKNEKKLELEMNSNEGEK